MNITIIGAGPRGLSIALYALYKNYNVTLIDSTPLHTWTSNYLISDLEMRSPLSYKIKWNI
jgi:thioredoxin reductase